MAGAKVEVEFDEAFCECVRQKCIPAIGRFITGKMGGNFDLNTWTPDQVMQFVLTTWLLTQEASEHSRMRSVLQMYCDKAPASGAGVGADVVDAYNVARDSDPNKLVDSEIPY